jgi:5-carboxymethyl-2-hydroxymuconate isomerase
MAKAGLSTDSSTTGKHAMPHFVVDCSQDILRLQEEEEIIRRLHEVALSSGLFDEREIKVRVNAFAVYATGNRREDFIHVFSSVMQGRSVEQRANLSRLIVGELVAMFPQVANIATNVAEFEKATYFNRSML